MADEFLRARTKEQQLSRQEEIKNACRMLFRETDYDGVSIKAISQRTSLTRSSIYTYYQTKEEILLDILKDELLLFQGELQGIATQPHVLTLEGYCKAFAGLLNQKYEMLRLYCLLFTMIENNVRLERLVVFKKEVYPVTVTMVELLLQYAPEYTLEEGTVIVQEIMSYLLGLFPMCFLTQKQKEAMEQSEMEYTVPDFAVFCYQGIRALVLQYDRGNSGKTN